MPELSKNNFENADALSDTLQNLDKNRESPGRATDGFQSPYISKNRSPRIETQDVLRKSASQNNLYLSN